MSDGMTEYFNEQRRSIREANQILVSKAIKRIAYLNEWTEGDASKFLQSNLIVHELYKAGIRAEDI